MKEKLLIILFLLFSLKKYAQDLMCGTTTPINYEAYENTNRTYDNSHNNIIDINALPVCINVYYHIVRKSDGSGGFDPSSLNEITNILNQSYNPINVFINSIGFDYIDNSRYYDCYNENEWYNIPPPYPNTANENFKIDFSNKPDGYFYEISLYDNNQNIKFQGTSDNIEKTINTLNLA